MLFHFTSHSPKVLCTLSVNGNPRLDGSEKELAPRLSALHVNLSVLLLSFQATISLILLPSQYTHLALAQASLMALAVSLCLSSALSISTAHPASLPKRNDLALA